jgi:hypothetical protein
MMKLNERQRAEVADALFFIALAVFVAYLAMCLTLV